MMLNRLDDYPVHQTPEPLAQPATGDRNFYDRTWFNGYAVDGSWYFGITMAVYPHLGVLDCAFSVVRPGGCSTASSPPGVRPRNGRKCVPDPCASM